MTAPAVAVAVLVVEIEAEWKEDEALKRHQKQVEEMVLSRLEQEDRPNHVVMLLLGLLEPAAAAAVAVAVDC